MPALYNSGGIFILYPAMRAAKVLSREEKLYIVSMFHKIASEVPVAEGLADHVLEFETELPTPEQCRPRPSLWDIDGGYVGDEL
jgi:hypothetical protein